MERESLEIKRQTFHLLAGLVLASLVYFDILNWISLSIITIIGAVIAIIDQKKRIPHLDYFRKNFERPTDYLGKGALTYFLGVLIVVAFFPKNIAVASTLILAVGDSFSHLIGKYYGKIKTRFSEHKNLEGFFAGWLLGGLSAWYFVGFPQAITAAGVAMLLEYADVTNILDDNILVPLVSALVLTLITLF